MSSGNCSCCFSLLKLLRGALVVGLLLWVLVVGGSPENQAERTRLAAAPPEPAAGDPTEQAHVGNHPELDLNFTSKVKVSKGPDPIHNRRMGINGKPPTQA